MYYGKTRMLHPTGSALTSDWFAYIFIVDVYENFYQPQEEGNVFASVCLSTIGLMATLSLLVLVTVRSVRTLLLSCFFKFSPNFLSKPRLKQFSHSQPFKFIFLKWRDFRPIRLIRRIGQNHRCTNKIQSIIASHKHRKHSSVVVRVTDC